MRVLVCTWRDCHPSKVGEIGKIGIVKWTLYSGNDGKHNTYPLEVDVPRPTIDLPARGNNYKTRPDTNLSRKQGQVIRSACYADADALGLFIRAAPESRRTGGPCIMH